MKIIKRPLPAKEFIQERYTKSQIYIHHTVSTGQPYGWWTKDNGRTRVATAYVITFDGTIYEYFNPSFWAFHLGIKAKYDMKSIGIELVNEGWLRRKNGKYYWFDGTYPFTRGDDKVIFQSWREESYWPEYTNKQYESLINLLDYLTARFSINKVMPYDLGYYPELLKDDYNGILYHCTVRKDKTDISPAFDILKVRNGLLKKSAILKPEIRPLYNPSFFKRSFWDLFRWIKK